MSIKHWPIKEQPREKLLAKGAHQLSDAELLALFIRSGTPGKSALDLAREALIRFGTLRALLNASMPQFCEQKGLGLSKYAQIQAALEITKRYLYENLSQKTQIQNSIDAEHYLTLRLRDQPIEIFSALFLDNKHQIICYEELFHGTLNQSSIYPREVVKQTLFHNAKAIIFAHNHPSGIAEPSTADIEVTKRLQQALEPIGVQILDHFVIGDGQCISFAKNGFI